MNKELRKLVREAERRGARLKYGGSHIKVFDGPELVAVLPQGRNRDKVPGGADREIRKAFAARGWVDPRRE